jgi:LAGLIDADG endonuclease
MKMKNLNIKNELNIDQAKPAKSNTPLGVQLNPNWVTGFMDGEGSFIIAILPSTGPLKNKISLRISITQKAHSKIVLFYLQKFFDCGCASE